MPAPQRTATQPGDVTDAGRFGEAFMVDTGVAAVPASGWQIAYGAASNGDGWRVMWSDENDYSVRTSGIGPDGTLCDAEGRLVGHEEYATSGLSRSLVSTGSGFMAVWTAGYSSIWAAMLDSAGTVIDSFPVFVSDSAQGEPAVAFDGDSTCLVVWAAVPHQSIDIYAARVTTGGQVLDPVPFPVAEESQSSELWPTAAFGQGVYLVAWTAIDTGGMSAAAKVVRVSAGGAVLDTAIFLRHDPAAVQAYGTATFGDTCFLAAWAEGIAEPNVFAARISASGNIIDTAGIQLSSSSDLDVYPSAAFNGTRYLVAWSEADDMSYRSSLCGRRVTADGVPLDSGPIRPGLAGYDCTYPSVVADRANFLVAFTTQDTVTSDANVCCVRISPDGAVLDSGIFFPLGADVQSAPSGASDGTDFLAAWLETRSQGQTISAARISADGVLLDPVGFTVNDAPSGKGSLATAFGDSIYLVAWEDYRGTDGPDIYCTRVADDGQVLDPQGIVVCSEPSYQSLPDISFDGQNFLVVWQDYRSLIDNDLYAARVSPSGLVLDPDGFAVAIGDSFDDAGPAACFTGTNHLLAWQGLDRGVGEINIYGALVSPAGSITRPRFVISGASGDQLAPAVERGPTNSLVCWEDTRLSGYDIYAARVRADGTVLDSSGVAVAGTGYDEQLPRVTSDAAGFRVLWHRWEYSDSTFFAVARVDTAGGVTRTGDWFGLPGSDNGFDAVYGSGPELLLLFSCRTDTALGRYYGTDRLWGRLDEVPGIEEADTRQLGSVTCGASVVRGVLNLHSAIHNQKCDIALLDISGRKVLDLHPGTNDVSRLSPGIYFCRRTAACASAIEAQTQSVMKVIVAR